MAKKSETGGTKALPDEMLESVAGFLEQAFSESKFTVRVAEKKWGIDRASLSKARNKKGAVGVHLLLKLRELIGKPIDELLALPPLEAMPKRKPLVGIAMPATSWPSVATGPSNKWQKRDEAVAMMRSRGASESTINKVVERFADEKHQNHRVRWWCDEIEKTGKAEAERVESGHGGRSADVIPVAPTAKPATTRKRRSA